MAVHTRRLFKFRFLFWNVSFQNHSTSEIWLLKFPSLWRELLAKVLHSKRLLVSYTKRVPTKEFLAAVWVREAARFLNKLHAKFSGTQIQVNFQNSAKTICSFQLQLVSIFSTSRFYYCSLFCAILQSSVDWNKWNFAHPNQRRILQCLQLDRTFEDCIRKLRYYHRCYPPTIELKIKTSMRIRN